jgi:hypothetical protein
MKQLHREAHGKRKKYVLVIVSRLAIVASLTFLLGVLSACESPRSILLIVPNNAAGKFFVIESKTEYQEHDDKVYDTEKVYMYSFHERSLKVKDISLFRTIPIDISEEWVSPVDSDRVKLAWKSKSELEISIR